MCHFPCRLQLGIDRHGQMQFASQEAALLGVNRIPHSRNRIAISLLLRDHTDQKIDLVTFRNSDHHVRVLQIRLA